MVSKTTLVCTAAYNADVHLHARPVAQAANSNKMSKIFFYLGCSYSCEKMKKRQNWNFVYTFRHIVVSKTTLTCTATCNAKTTGKLDHATEQSTIATKSANFFYSLSTCEKNNNKI